MIYMYNLHKRLYLIKTRVYHSVLEFTGTSHG